jgi:hypothetical protein
LTRPPHSRYLTRSQTGQPARPGRCLLNTGDGHLITITVPSVDYYMDLGSPMGLSTRGW